MGGKMIAGSPVLCVFLSTVAYLGTHVNSNNNNQKERMITVLFFSPVHAAGSTAALAERTMARDIV
jgi:hypothetical protein